MRAITRLVVLAVAFVVAATLMVDAQINLRRLLRVTPAGGGGGGGTGITFDAGFDGTGTFSDGQVVTITRSSGSWGTKPGAAKPLYYWPLETNLNPDATYSRTTSNPSAWSAEASFSTAILAPNAAGSARVDLTCPIAGGGNCVMGPDSGVTFSGIQAYLWTQRYFPTALTPAEFNLKFPRFWGAGTCCQNFYEGMQGNEGTDGAPRYSVEHIPTGSGVSIFNGHGFREDEWMTDEWEYQNSSAINVNDGQFHHIRNGTYALPRASTRWTLISTDEPTPVALVFGEQHSNNITASPWYVYWNAYVVDDSWCRVMISPESTWNVTGAVSTSNPGTEVTREYQPATSWATQSITHLIRRGTLTLSGKYLWVIGGTGCTTATRIGQFT